MLSDDGASYEQLTLPSTLSTGSSHFAWRAIAHPLGGLVVLHQSHSAVTLPASTNRYYSPSLATSALTYYPLLQPIAIGQSGLFVDVAMYDASRLAVAEGGVRETSFPSGVSGTQSAVRVGFDQAAEHPGNVAVAYAPDGTLWAQRRDPPLLVDEAGATIALADATV